VEAARPVRGIADEVAARDEILVRVAVVRLVRARDIGLGPLQVGDAEAVRVAVGHGGVPQRRGVEDLEGAIQDVGDGVAVFPARVVGGRMRRPVAGPDGIDVARPHHDLGPAPEVVPHPDERVHEIDHAIEDLDVAGGLVHQAHGLHVAARGSVGDVVVVGVVEPPRMRGDLTRVHVRLERALLVRGDRSRVGVEDDLGVGQARAGDEADDGDQSSRTRLHGSSQRTPSVEGRDHCADGVDRMLGSAAGPGHSQFKRCAQVPEAAGGSAWPPTHRGWPPARAARRALADQPPVCPPVRLPLRLRVWPRACGGRRPFRRGNAGAIRMCCGVGSAARYLDGRGAIVGVGLHMVKLYEGALPAPADGAPGPPRPSVRA
jgi:hypothetical protein